VTTAPGDPTSALGEAVKEEYQRVSRRGQIREVVFGAQDGLLSTLALVTGVAGSNADADTIVVAGLVGAVAGTISMALGAYVAAKSQREVFDHELEQERRQLQQRYVVERLELAAIFVNEGLSHDAATRAADAISENPETMLKTMAEKELGIAFDPPGSPLLDAAVMGTSFVVGSVVPILPYLLLGRGPALLASIVATLGTLFGIGVLKSRLSASSWWRSGAEIVALAGAAALLAYLIGTVLPSALGYEPPATG
jgi:vacuolar iron transporter family protein